MDYFLLKRKSGKFKQSPVIEQEKYSIDNRSLSHRDTVLKTA
jgi:hypothetical protein